jgi:hypothetical protein
MHHLREFDVVLGTPTLPFIAKGVGLQGRYQINYYNDPNQDSIPNLPNLQKAMYRLLKIELWCLGPHALVVQSTMQDRPSPCGPLLHPSESTRLGILGTNAHQEPPIAWQVNNHLVIFNLPYSWWSCRVLNFRNQVLYCQNSRVLSYRDWVLSCQVEWIGAPIRCSPDSGTY